MSEMNELFKQHKKHTDEKIQDIKKDISNLSEEIKALRTDLGTDIESLKKFRTQVLTIVLGGYAIIEILTPVVTRIWAGN